MCIVMILFRPVVLSFIFSMVSFMYLFLYYILVVGLLCYREIGTESESGQVCVPEKWESVDLSDPKTA